MADPMEKLRAFFDLFPKVKGRVENIEATLDQIGVTSKENVQGSEGISVPSDSKSEDGGAEKKEMDTKEMPDEMKKKMEAEEEKKEGTADDPKEEAAEKKEAAVAEAAVATPTSDQAAQLLAQIQQGFEASTKEAKELRELFEASQKEFAALSTTLEEGLKATRDALAQRDVTIKELQEQNKLLTAKVTELAGEVPNAARNAYHPSADAQNLISQIRGDSLAAAKEAVEKANQTDPAQTNTHPIFSFLNEANSRVGIAQPTPQNLPQ